MLELNQFFSSTLQFEVTQVEKAPENSYDVKSWEQGRGVYHCKTSDNLFFVGKYSVDNIYSVSDKGFFKIVENEYESPKVEERLFLKAIAAASGHNL
jgi:peptide methionine sulfoxide reductase MsrB